MTDLLIDLLTDCLTHFLILILSLMTNLVHNHWKRLLQPVVEDNRGEDDRIVSRI